MKEKFLLEEYREAWSYYKHTIDDRNKTFGYFFQLVGLPATLVMILFIGGNQFKFGETSTDVDPTPVAIVLSIISLVGLFCYVTYVVNSRASYLYTKQIKRIRRHIAPEQDELFKVLDMETDRNQNSSLPGVAFYRGMILCSLNAGVILAACTLAFDLNAAGHVVVFIAAIFLQYSIGRIAGLRYPEDMQDE